MNYLLTDNSHAISSLRNEERCHKIVVCCTQNTCLLHALSTFKYCKFFPLRFLGDFNPSSRSLIHHATNLQRSSEKYSSIKQYMKHRLSLPHDICPFRNPVKLLIWNLSVSDLTTKRSYLHAQPKIRWVRIQPMNGFLMRISPMPCKPGVAGLIPGFRLLPS